MLPSTLTLFLCYLKIRNMFLFCVNQRAPNPILDLCFLNVKKIESNVNRGKITFPDCQQTGAKMRVRPLLMRTQTSESKSCAATDSHEMEIKAALMYIKISRNIMLIEYNQTSAMSFLTLRYEFSLLMSTLLCSQCLL